MKKFLFLALAPIVVATMCSCGQNSQSTPAQEIDSTLCQFSNVKVEKMVDFPESGKSYLVIVNELKAAVAPPMPQAPQQQAAPQNPFLDQLNQMQWNNPLMPPAMPQMPPPMPGGSNQ